MSEIYKRFAMVIADLDRLSITNEDPMRYSKRCCVLEAQTALEDGVRRAEEMLCMVQRIESDTVAIIKGEE